MCCVCHDFSWQINGDDDDDDDIHNHSGTGMSNINGVIKVVLYLGACLVKFIQNLWNLWMVIYSEMRE